MADKFLSRVTLQSADKMTKVAVRVFQAGKRHGNSGYVVNTSYGPNDHVSDKTLYVWGVNDGVRCGVKWEAGMDRSDTRVDTFDGGHFDTLSDAIAEMNKVANDWRANGWIARTLAGSGSKRNAFTGIPVSPGSVKPVVSEPVVSEPVVSEIVSEPVVSEPVVSEPVVSEPVVSEIVSEPFGQYVVSEPVVSEPVVSEPTHGVFRKGQKRSA